MTSALALALAGTTLAFTSGAPVLVLRRNPLIADRWAAAVAVLGSALGLLGALLAVASGGDTATWQWSLPGASFAIGIDGLSALFLVP
ncbi:MAG: hydrogenase, partial [Planctomycetes bacterium]|nr:hydrogenase [Planctomycetota bacterium]